MFVPRRAILVGLFAALSTLVCAALLIAAVLVPAPTAVLPLVIAACLGCPMAAAYELARAVAAARDPHLELRRELDRLPETPHPLDL
jgi:ABC-type nitrate/sulfonate/bicarbonate transport system permease component